MSTINSANMQIGQSTTAANNVTLSASSSGDLIINRGEFPALTEVARITSAGRYAADKVTYTPVGTGAIPRTLQDKERERAVSVKDYGAFSDGTNPVATRAAFIAAHAASTSVFYPNGTYNLGDVADGNILINLLAANISIFTEGSVTLTCNMTSAGVAVLYHLENATNFYCGPISIVGYGYNPLATWQGVVAFDLVNTNSNWGNIFFESIYAKNLVGALRTYSATPSAANRIRGINIGQLFLDDCYYGINCINEGDDVVVDLIYAYRVYRAYFAYGVRNHKANIVSRNARSSTGVVNISRSSGGLDTSEIDIKYNSRDQVDVGVHVNLNHFGPTTGTIKNIKLDLNIDDVTSASIKVVTYTVSGGVETATATANVVTGLVISGKYTVPATCTATYTTNGTIEFNSANGSQLFDASIPTNFKFSSPISYTPIWSCSGTPPSLGNGTISGSYFVVNGICHAKITIIMGSTTTYGNNNWTTSLPIKPSAYANLVGVAKVLNSGVCFYTGIAEVVNGTSTIMTTIHSATNQTRSTVPHTWKSGDFLDISVSYSI